MAENKYWESFKAEGETFADKIKSVIHEGNIRRVVVQHQGRTIAEFPADCRCRRNRAGPCPRSGRGAGGAAQGLHDSDRAGSRRAREGNGNPDRSEIVLITGGAGAHPPRGAIARLNRRRGRQAIGRARLVPSPWSSRP